MTKDPWQTFIDGGNAACARRRYPEAERILLEALILAEAFGEDDPRLALTLNNLGAVYQLQGKYGFAETHYQRSLEIKMRILGPDHLEVAVGLNNMGMLLCARRKFEESEPYFKEVLRIREAALAGDHPDVKSVLRNYAQMLEEINRKEEAQELKTRAASADRAAAL